MDSPVESFSCEHCGRSFSRKENLSRHLRNHESEKTHQCPQCFKSFARSDVLKRHLRLHDPGAPFESSAVQSSKRRRHNDNEPVPAMHVDAGHHNAHPETLSMLTPATDTVSDFPLDQLWAQGVLFGPPDSSGHDLNVPFEWDDILSLDTPFGVTPGYPPDEQGDNPVGSAHVPSQEFSISRAPSPPNEASHEDRTPYAWSPSSRPLRHARKIVLAPDDPLLASINPSFQLSPATYENLAAALSKELVVDSQTLIRPLPVFPDLDVVNVLMTRFAECFLPQAPVLHKPTMRDINEMPDYCLAIMVSIGAVYTNRKSSRRFAILLQEWARSRLQLCVELENSILRSSTTIYAAALICYSGLWCGNKRAFELAEGLRGSVIAWMRRFAGGAQQHDESFETSSRADEIDAHWRAWVQREYETRLFWTVYTLDSSYASLANMSPAMTLAEVQGWNCPCDDEYWLASSALQWRSLVGRAMEPPTRSFEIVIAPFIIRASNYHPIPGLNRWSASLILLGISLEILAYQGRRQMLRRLTSMGFGSSGDSEGEEVDVEAQRLWSALSLWRRNYTFTGGGLSRVFSASSENTFRLCQLQLRVPISDLQDILGKSGLQGIASARSRFTDWMSRGPDSLGEALCETFSTLQRFYHCPGLATEVGREVQSHDAWANASTSPYSSILVFLAHVFVYACSATADCEQKAALYGKVVDNLQIDSQRPISRLLDASLGPSADSTGRMVLRLGADLLSRYENWACSLNLALLLHWRSKV